jgi:hypothetical protein
MNGDSGLSAVERMMILNRYLDTMRDRGYVITEQVDAFTVDIRELQAEPEPPNHILHLLLAVFTCGLWAIVWIAVYWDFSRDRRQVDRQPYFPGTWQVHVSQAGQVESYEINPSA